MYRSSRQRTVAHSIKATGVGLHNGTPVSVELMPAPMNSGIVFVRTDLPGCPRIPATVDRVTSTQMCTTIGNGDAKVSTVEHMLSALSGMGVDNVEVHVSGPEVPAMDGSAAAFVFLIQSTGIKEQSAPVEFFKVKKPVRVEREGGAWCELKPHDGLHFSFSIEYEHPFMQRHPSQLSVDVTASNYARLICRARTYGFIEDLDRLTKEQLAQGADVANAVVIGEHGVMNEAGLRYDDECVRHKILDAQGDLMLLGGPMLGAFTGHKSGHQMNCRLLRKLLETEGAVERVTLTADDAAPELEGTLAPVSA